MSKKKRVLWVRWWPFFAWGLRFVPHVCLFKGAQFLGKTPAQNHRRDLPRTSGDHGKASVKSNERPPFEIKFSQKFSWGSPYRSNFFWKFQNSWWTPFAFSPGWPIFWPNYFQKFLKLFGQVRSLKSFKTYSGTSKHIKNWSADNTFQLKILSSVVRYQVLKMLWISVNKL